MDANLPAGATLKLAPCLDLKASAPLKDAILALRGADVTLDGADVSRLGGLCLQVLVAARATWSGEGRRLEIGDASEAFRETAALMGALAVLGLEDQEERR